MRSSSIGLGLLFTGLFSAPCLGAQELRLSDTRVEVGEPFELVLDLPEVEALDAGRPDLDDSYAVLDASVRPTASGVRFTWTVASLEAGSRLVGLLPGADLPEPPPALRVEVVSVLAPDATEPRPIRALPEDWGTARPAPHVSSPWPWILAALLLFAVVAFALWARRRRAGAPNAEAPRPTPAARLERLARERAAGPEDVSAAALHHDWAAILREAVDVRRAGSSPERARLAASTDEEWLAGLEHAPDPVLRDLQPRIAAALDACTRARFGGERPSAFAVEALESELTDLVTACTREPRTRPPSEERAA